MEVETETEGAIGDEAGQAKEAVAGPEEAAAGEEQTMGLSETGEAAAPEARVAEAEGEATTAATDKHMDEAGHAEATGERGVSSAGDASMAEAAQEGKLRLESTTVLLLFLWSHPQHLFVADSEATSPSYHPQTQSGFVLSLSSEPSASASAAPPAGTRATFSTAFSSTEALVASTSAAPLFDVRSKFVEPIRLLFGEMTVGGWDSLSAMKRRLATHSLRNFRSMVIDSLSAVGSATDLGEVLEAMAGEESQMQRMGFRLVGFQDVLQRLYEFHASWAEVETQAKPQPPFAKINAEEEGLQDARRHLVGFNHSRSGAQVAVAEADEQSRQVLSEREVVAAQICDFEAKLADLRGSMGVLDRRLAEIEARRASAQKAVEVYTLEASMCESQIAACNTRLAFLRSAVVEPDPALLQLFSDHRAAVDALQGAFCDLFENIIP